MNRSPLRRTSPLRGGLIFICFALALVHLEAGTSSTNQPSSEPETLTFTDVSAEAGFSGNSSSWAAAWGDYDNDGNADVVTLAHIQDITNSISQLWHNNGDNTFTDVTIPAGLNPNNGDAHGAVWADFDKDGYLDLYVSKGTPKADSNNYNELWKNNGDNTFTNVASSSGVTGRVIAIEGLVP